MPVQPKMTIAWANGLARAAWLFRATTSVSMAVFSRGRRAVKKGAWPLLQVLRGGTVSLLKQPRKGGVHFEPIDEDSNSIWH